MKKTSRDKDSFDIKKTENRYDKKNKDRVFNTRKDYSKGEQSPYWDWRSEMGNYDPIDLDNLTDTDAPWRYVAPSETVEGQWEGLKLVYPTLKGRQKQVVDLLLKGNTNQTLIAIQLGLKQYDVNKILKVIAKKILKKIP
jgi:hypothetical protein